MHSDLAEIGDRYNGICTSYGKCIHEVGIELLYHRVTNSRLNNQIEFIINHIATQPDYLNGNGLFEAFQQNHEKWAKIESEIHKEYIRGEEIPSPEASDTEHNYCKDRHPQVHTHQDDNRSYPPPKKLCTPPPSNK